MYLSTAMQHLSNQLFLSSFADVAKRGTERVTTKNEYYQIIQMISILNIFCIADYTR
jgi:hypothetical protein